MAIDLQKVKKRLEEKEKQLRQQITGRTEAHSTAAGSVDVNEEGTYDFEEIASDFLERQQERSLLRNEQELLADVQAALQRIAKGMYGRCVDCGQPIPQKRLEVIPWAARCVKDEATLEQGSHVRKVSSAAETM